jgi:hypothetical protein
MSQASAGRRGVDMREKAQTMLKSVLISRDEDAGALAACRPLPLDPDCDLSP